MFLSAVCDRTAKVQNFPDVTIGKSQNFPTLIYFSIYTYSTCHMEGTPTASTKTDKLSESCKFSLFFLFVSKLILIFAPAFSNECKDILPNGLLITTRECRAKTTDIGTDPNLGADFPYSVVACGEPRDLWR